MCARGNLVTPRFGGEPLSNFGSLTMLTAIRRASSRASSCAAARRPDCFLEIDVGERLTVVHPWTMKQASVSSTDHGGGKRRGSVTRRDSALRS